MPASSAMIGRSECRGEPRERIHLEHLRPARSSSRTSTRPASRQPRQRQVASATVFDLARSGAGFEQPVVDELSPLGLVAVRIDAGIRALEQHDLERRERARRVARAEDADRELAAGQIVLDEHRLPIALEQLACRPRRAPPRDVTSDCAVTPLLVPSATGFTNSGNGRRDGRRLGGVVDEREVGVGTPQPRATCFAMPLCNVSAQTSGSENV